MKLLKIILFTHLFTAIVSAAGVIEYNGDDNLIIRTFSGPEARAFVKDIADMRITMFREYPYLYEGTFADEQEYLEIYFSCPDASIVLVFDQQEVVGFSSSIPLRYETKELTVPFTEYGKNIDDYLYIGEVMIKPDYRGKGLLRAFFTYHEERALAQGYTSACFMTVIRPEDHSLKPHNYRLMRPIWNHFGYILVPDLQVHFTWTQVDTQQVMDNTLAIWEKRLLDN